MAVDRGLSHAVGDALVALIDWAWPRGAYRVDGLLDRVADVVRPDPPLTIRSLEGHLLTGLLVADRGQVILFIGTRSPASGSGPFHHEPHTRRNDDGAVPLWARDIDPPELHDLEVDPYRRR